MDNFENQKKTSDLPAQKWIIFFCIAWLIIGSIPLVFVLIGTYFFSFVSNSELAVAGTIGDSFGFVNSFFSTSALLFVIWSVKLQREEISLAQKEWQENTESQKEQARLMKEAAYLTAINNIYQHYNFNFGAEDKSGILNSIADGHRKWAIKETFNIIDNTLIELDKKQVFEDYEILKTKLISPSQDKVYLNEVANIVSNLLINKNLNVDLRKSLWSIYEILRRPPGIYHVTQNSFSDFEVACSKIVSNNFKKR